MIETPDRAFAEDRPALYALHNRNQLEVKVKSALWVRGVRVLVTRITMHSHRRVRLKLLAVLLFSGYHFVYTKMIAEACKIKRPSHV